MQSRICIVGVVYLSLHSKWKSTEIETFNRQGDSMGGYKELGKQSIHMKPFICIEMYWKSLLKSKLIARIIIVLNVKRRNANGKPEENWRSCNCNCNCNCDCVTVTATLQLATSTTAAGGKRQQSSIFVGLLQLAKSTQNNKPSDESSILFSVFFFLFVANWKNQQSRLLVQPHAARWR